MSDFKTTKLGEIASVISGYAFKSKEFGDEGIPVIKIANIRVGDVDLTESAFVATHYLSNLNKKYRIGSGDILISLTGSHLTQPNSVVGRVARMPASAPVALLNQRAGKVIVSDTDRCDSGYLYRFLSVASQRGDIAVMASGAASQANVSPTQVESLDVPLPDLSTQHRIASILSAYDNLIENNTRRIAILEEMARRLYEEWFVKFRFPGHEEVSFDGELPEDWEQAALGEYLSKLESGKRPKGGVGSLNAGVPSVGAENVVGIGVHNYRNEKFVSNSFFEGLNKGVVRDRDVALYKDGAYIGRSTYFRDSFPHSEFCVNEHVFLLRGDGLRLLQNYLYLWLQRSTTVAAVRATNANAAQPGINQTGVKGLKILVPSKDVGTKFDETVEPFFALIICLAKKNSKLRAQRDLLLPKLVSGEIDVSDVELREGEEDAA